MRAITVEPVNPLSNPTSLSISTGTTIPATARYIIRLTATVETQLSGRSGKSNLIQNEGANNVTIYPVGGSPSFTLSPGYECRLTWDATQNKHEVQQPQLIGGSGTVDTSLSAVSTNPVTNAAITTKFNSITDGTAVVKATGVGATDKAALEAACDNYKYVLIDDRDSPLVLNSGGPVYCHESIIRPFRDRANIQLSNSTNLQFGEYYTTSTFTTNWNSFTVSSDKSSVNCAGLTNVAVGDCLIFTSGDQITDMAPHHASGYQYPGEIALVRKIDGTTYYLEKPLVETYSTSPKCALLSRTNASGSVKKLSVDCGIEDITFEGSNNSASDANAVLFYSCLRPRAKRLNTEAAGKLGFYLSLKPRVSDIEIPYQVLANSTYGIAVGWCDEGIFERINGSDCRHVWTCGGALGPGTPTRYGTNKDNVVRDSIANMSGKDAASNSSIAWDTHSEAYRTRFERVTAVLGATTATTAYGFNDRGRYTRYDGCRVIGNKTLPHTGWLLVSAFHPEVVNCSMVGGACAVRTDTSDYAVAGGGRVNCTSVTVEDSTFTDLKNEAIIFNMGAGHRARRVTARRVGSSATGLFGAVRSCIAFYDQDALGLSDCAVEDCVLPKDENLYSVGIGPLTRASLSLLNNQTDGYGDESIGLNRTLTEAPTIEAVYANQQRNRDRRMYVNDTAHGYTTADIGKPIDTSLNIYDDTAALVPIMGILTDVIDANWFVLALPGQYVNLADSILTGSYNPASDGRVLYWDASAGKMTKTKPGDSHASAPVMLQVGSYFDSKIRARIVAE